MRQALEQGTVSKLHAALARHMKYNYFLAHAFTGHCTEKS